MPQGSLMISNDGLAARNDLMVKDQRLVNTLNDFMALDLLSDAASTYYSSSWSSECDSPIG